MLTLQEEKHVLCFDDRSSIYSSYLFTLERPGQNEEGEKGKAEVSPESWDSFSFEIKVSNKFTFEWSSLLFSCELIPRGNHFGSCPLSLENYLEYYQDPKRNRFRLTLNEGVTAEERQGLYGQSAGKIIIKTHFKGSVVKLPVNISDEGNPRLSTDCPKKHLCVISERNSKETVVCAASLLSVLEVEEVSNFFRSGETSACGYTVYMLGLNERVESEHVVVARAGSR